MATDVQGNNSIQAIGFADVILFFKKFWGNILIFVFPAGLVAALIIGSIYQLTPRQSQYVATINLQLPRMCYPSGKAFSAHDVISAPVLRKVYNDNNLEKRLPFASFCRLFSLSGSSMERYFLAARYRNKLADKKINVIQLRQIEDEYESALRELDNSNVSIAMVPTKIFGSQESVKILNEIPVAWFSIYSIQEARNFPRVDSVLQVEALRKVSAGEGYLIALDKTRTSCRSLENGCRELGKILAGQKVALPSGETLEDLQERLAALEKHYIGTLLMLVLETRSLQGPFDEIFLRSCILEIEREITKLKNMYDANIATINVLYSGSNSAKEFPTGSGARAASSMTMNLDFFNSLSNLIRSSQTIKVREGYARKALEYKEKLSVFEAEKGYYKSMLEHLSSQKTATGNRVNMQQIQMIEKAMYDEMILLCRKVNEFRDLVFRDYHLSKQFFIFDSIVSKQTSFTKPVLQIAAGIVLLFMGICALYVIILFYGAFTRGQLKK